MKKYYLQKYVERDHTAGTKGVLDVEFFVEQIAFKPLYKLSTTNSKLSKLANIFANIGKLDNNTILLTQYPIHSRLRVKELKLIRKLYRKITLVSIIQDIPSLRTDHDKIEHDLDQLNLFDYIISHNSRMSKWLADQKVKPVVSDLELFDYKAEVKADRSISDFKSMCFAGNLNKSGFIYEFGKQVNGIKLNVYGPNIDQRRIDSSNGFLDYKGSYEPDILHTLLEGAFGLVWDGDSIDTCSGDLGEYTRYNNPNKLSLYIASGLPVIVWSEAAIAKVVEENGIGFAVASLKELEEKLNRIDEEIYASYRKNIAEMQNKVINGYFIKSAVGKILERTKDSLQTKLS